MTALGFGATPVALSVIVESLLLVLLGSVIGIALIYFAPDELQAHSNFLGDTQYAFTLSAS